MQSYGGAGDFANITTFADNAIALFAQSVGGGGGTAGTTGISMADGEITGSIWGSTGGAGVGGPVTVDHAGAISTIGDGATGIFAQSAGGTGTSAGADVTVSVDGSVIVSGTDASAIFAQSVMLNSSGAAIGAGSSHVTVAAGSTVKGGTAGDIQSGAGVEIRDGVSNTVTNNGTITSAGGNAIVYVGSGTCEVNGSGSCQTSVSNTGLIDGNVLFGGPGGGRGKVDNSGRIIGAFVDGFAESRALPAASDAAETATRVINREGGEIITAGTSTFDQIKNYGRIEVEGDGGQRLSRTPGSTWSTRGRAR